MNYQKAFRDVYPEFAEKRLVRMSDINKEKRLKVLNQVFSIALGLVLPLLLVIFGFIIQNYDYNALQNLLGNFGVIVLNLLFVYFILFGLLSFSNRASGSYFLTAVIYLALPVISRLKYEVRGEVLIHNDFALVGKMGELVGFVEIERGTVWLIVLIIMFIIGTTVLVTFQKIKTNRVTSRIIFAILSVLMCIVFVIPSYSKTILNGLNVNLNIRFSPNIMHEKLGTILGFYANYKMNNVQKPDNYSRETVFAILDNAKKEIEERKQKEKELLEVKYGIEDSTEPISGDSSGDHLENKVIKLADNKKSKTEEIKPNIIMIMSESFFDPTRMKNVTFSKDPIPTVREMTKKYTSGKLITSTFGGATSNVEYEAFTGETSEFMPYGTVPYTDLMEEMKNVETIQKVLKNNGYKTIGLHTYEGDFYNRRENYQHIGFDVFKDMNELESPGYYGKYVSDLTLMNNIIKEIEDHDGKEPLYIWALTMQNHTPYATSNYDEDAIKIQVTGSKLSDLSKDKLTAYTNGIYESDRCLKMLIDYLDECETPTVLLFYGDHLPSLYETYYDTEMISTKDTSKWSTEELLDLHTIPFFIYNNYNLKEEYNHDETLGAMLLGNRLLTEAGIQKSAYFNFLDTINYKALRDRLFIDEYGRAFPGITEECEEKASEHKMLQYDMLYGSNYISEYEKIY